MSIPYDVFNNKIPVFSIGYFGIVLSNNIKTKLFDFYPVPLNSRQKEMLKDYLASKSLEIKELGSTIKRFIEDNEAPPKPIFIVVDTSLNNFKDTLSSLDEFVDKIKVILCIRVAKQQTGREEIKNILEAKPHKLDLMTVIFEGDDKTSIHKAKNFFEVTDFILSSTGFINMSLRDVLTLGDVVFFSKYDAPEIIEVQKQVIEDFKRYTPFIDHKSVKKIIISFRAPLSLTVTDVNDALQTIVSHLPKDVEVQWSLFASETNNVEIFTYFGLNKDFFL